LITTTTTFPECEFSAKALKDCQDSLSFVDLSKEGAQDSRTTWKDEADRLACLLKREKNSTKSYKEKWEEMSKLYTECFSGYQKANDSLDFSVLLANDISGQLRLVNKSFFECKNLSLIVETALDSCRNDSAKDAVIVSDQQSNITKCGRRLSRCRKLLQQSESAHNKTKQDLTGIAPLCPFCPFI
jgi:hypothetical protein